MELFLVYIRSMCTYTDHTVPETLKYVDYKSSLKVFKEIAYFKTFEEAYDWIITNGKKFTEKFYDITEEGCAFTIMKKKTLEIDLFDEDFLDLSRSYLLDRTIFHYVFSELSYKMCLTEHLMYYSHDWDSLFPSWIKYVKRKNSIFIGCDHKHIKKAHKLITYNNDNDNKQKNEIDVVKKYNKTKNINDLNGLYNNKMNEY